MNYKNSILPTTLHNMSGSSGNRRFLTLKTDAFLQPITSSGNLIFQYLFLQ